MPVLARQLVSLLALLTIAVGSTRVQPCLDDDEHAVQDSSARLALHCPSSDQHHDPSPPTHTCACMCHVPVVAMNDAVIVGPWAPAQLGSVPVQDPLSSGHLDALFRPPRA